MNIIQQAKEFVQRLLHPDDPRRCPRCKKRMTKRNGGRWVKIRDLDGQGEHPHRHQNWWCYLCGKSYYVADPRREKYARYTHRVQRKGLDMYFHLGGSLRRVTEFLRSEINGNERCQIWDPLSRLKPEPEKAVKLHHTTLWRWEQKAGKKVQHDRKAGLWRGVTHFSGALVADSTGMVVRGVQETIHWIGDAVSDLSLRLQRLIEENELVVRGQFRATLQNWGLAVEEVKALISDGASWYQAVIAEVLRQARQQRSLFHLWRNILSTIRLYRSEAGWPLAKELIIALQKVWNAPSLEKAQKFLAKVRRKWRYATVLQEALNLVAKTLPVPCQWHGTYQQCCRTLLPALQAAHQTHGLFHERGWL